MSVASQQNTEIVKPSNDSLKLYSINKKNGNGCFVLADVVQKYVLYIL